ncbi:MAG: ATP-binding protein [Synergistaceae bacterium]|nr:ATP-binding protein [Synergistaceae bacterium]
MIARNTYLEKLKNAAWNGKIKVITGIRRCGKSFLLFEIFQKYLLSIGVSKKNIIKFELDQLKDAEYRDPFRLYKCVNSKIQNSNEKYYLLIDEVQLSIKTVHPENSSIEITVYDLLNDFRNRKNLDVYVTGSNSKMLSNDIATEFRGRATQIHVWPLSFAEYNAGIGGSVQRNFSAYMKYGGMPEIAAISDETAKKDYLESLFNELYIKDIVERQHIMRRDVLEKLLDFLSSSTGSLTNPANITNSLRSQHLEINHNTVSNYIGYIRDAFLINEAKRYDIKGKRYFDYPNKYYYTDPGLRNARLNFRQPDPGHTMENIIYNDLKARGCSVDIGVLADRKSGNQIQREIDFVVNLYDKRLYIQSAFEMASEEKQMAETAPLKLSKDFFTKIIVRNDIDENWRDNYGILHCRVTGFLLSDSLPGM